MQRARALTGVAMLVGVAGVLTACAAATPERPSQTAAPESESLRLQEAVDLPVVPPELSVASARVAPVMVDWAVSAEPIRDLQEDPTAIPSIVIEPGTIRMQLQGAPTPTALTIGIYPNGVANIDSSVPPPVHIDCFTDKNCTIDVEDTTITVTLVDHWPPGATATVWAITASYVGVRNDMPYGNSIAWAFEALPN